MSLDDAIDTPEDAYLAGLNYSDDDFADQLDHLVCILQQDTGLAYEALRDWPQERMERILEPFLEPLAQDAGTALRAGKEWDRRRFMRFGQPFVDTVTADPLLCQTALYQWGDNFAAFRAELLSGLAQSPACCSNFLISDDLPATHPYTKPLVLGAAKDPEHCYRLGKAWGPRRITHYEGILISGLARSPEAIYKAGRDWNTTAIVRHKDLLFPTLLSDAYWTAEACHDWPQKPYTALEDALARRHAVSKTSLKRFEAQPALRRFWWEAHLVGGPSLASALRPAELRTIATAYEFARQSGQQQPFFTELGRAQAEEGALAYAKAIIRAFAEEAE